MCANFSQSVVAFYQQSGRALVDETNYPSAITEHLVGERRLLRRHLTARGYSAVVEVGCMDGAVHLQTLLDSGIKYLGIDLVPDAIARLNRRLRQWFPDQDFPKARTLDVCHLQSVRQELRSERVLVVFPFNAFGNLCQPEEAIKAVYSCGYDALILTYRTDTGSTNHRSLYYQSCNYESLEAITDDRGVLFRSGEGLHSYAYHPDWLSRLLVENQFRCRAKAFGDLGLCYLATQERV